MPQSPTPLRSRALDAARRSGRLVVAELGTPSASTAPLFGEAGARWLRLMPYAVVFVFVVTLLPVTASVLTQDYRLGGAVAGALATAQTAPLLLAVTRPLQAWWIVLAADVAGGFALMGAGTAGRSWPWTPVVVVNLSAMTILCWHQTAMLAAAVPASFAGAVPGLTTPPDTLDWILCRTAWLPLFAALLVLLGRYARLLESPWPRRAGRAVRVGAGVLAAAFTLYAVGWA
ncbi:hypothetical protein ACIQ7Q_14580 [Streptomyces sp. NPDC096176]|uniref:hypothetical protein n=1 Tax=Streptomyces sp. NPDC096176 TaxID=3366079 RepID=UPI00381FF719